MRPQRTKALTIVAGVLLAVFALVGCTSAAPPPATGDRPAGSSDTIAAAHGLGGLDARSIIEQLEATPIAERPATLMAFVRPGELLLSDSTGQASLPLPDEFYLSVAPYAMKTHECYFHSLTTCLGELRSAAVHVKVVDAAGTVLIDENLHTNDNGFVGMWLPRGVEGTLTIDTDGRSATTPIATGEDDPTCLTTMKLT